MLNEKQREHFRLAYPDIHRPRLMMDSDSFEVADVSEFGVKVRVDQDPAFMVDDNVMATIEFPDGREFDLSAHVVRLDDGYAGLRLDTPLPLSVIRAEALYVMYNYPTH